MVKTKKHSSTKNIVIKNQLTLRSFFSPKNQKNDVRRTNSVLSTSQESNDAAATNDGSFSPDLIEATPESRSGIVGRFIRSLDFSIEKNDCEQITSSRKQLFTDSSNTVCNDQDNEEKSEKFENSGGKCGLKRSSDDALDELLEEIENSSSSCSCVSRSYNLENSHADDRKRLKLTESTSKHEMLGKNQLTLLVGNINERSSRNLPAPPKKILRSVFTRKNEKRNCSTSSLTGRIVNTTANSTCVDVENLGDLFTDDFEPVEVNQLNLNAWTYCKVIGVQKVQFGIKTQLQEAVERKSEPLSATCFIKGYWGESELKIGDVISIKARFDYSLSGWLVDENGGFLVKYPNLLISGTTIVGSLFCLRKAVLTYLFPGLDSPNISMLLGSLVHELFQKILRNKLYEENDMKSVADEILSRRRTLLESYECDISLTTLQTELLKFLPRITSFVNMYILNKEMCSSEKMWTGRIQEVLSIEENFWVPQLGVKGKTDLIVDAKTDAGAKTMPIELKTGRPTNSNEHRGQIILYLMMMNELSLNVDTGLLLYLKDNIMHQIIPRQGEMYGLVTVRNNLVDYFTKNEKLKRSCDNLFSVPILPEPINHHSACSKCPYLTVCSAALSRESNVKLQENNPLTHLSQFAVQHLSSSHIDYIFHWLGLLRLEGVGRSNGHFVDVSDIWLKNPDERQKRGSCIPHLNITDVEVCDDYFLHYMKCSNDLIYDLTSSGIIEGDYIVISSSHRFAVATGFVRQISATSLVLRLDRSLGKCNDGNYIVDKYSGTEGLLGFNCSNLLLLLENSNAVATLRSLIIDLKLPSFSSISDKLSEKYISVMAPLNKYQKKSIFKVLGAENFALIKGLPGTGKTATIVALVKILVQLNYSVLITSHTHSAVDNVLLRLKDSIDFLRLGSSHKVHSAIKSFCEDVVICDGSINSIQDVENFYNRKQVVGVTCMGCSHGLLLKRKFDFCIIDEATQVLQPSIIKALYSSSKFVLIGDPDQLPPVVHNSEASHLGLSQSLFHRLDRPEVTTILRLQYRMNIEIMKLANTFAYGDKLKCDDKDVKSATLQFKRSAIKGQPKWMLAVLSSDLSFSLVFLNTSTLTMQTSNSVYCNQLEADVVSFVIDALKKNFEESYEIGVIAPYREQVLLLRRHFSTNHSDVEINTIDQFQGRDKDVIIFSSTRWSNQKEEGILGDKRRLTVAVTRAKRKLIIIGNAIILRECSTFNSLLNCISKKNMIDVENLSKPLEQ